MKTRALACCFLALSCAATNCAPKTRPPQNQQSAEPLAQKPVAPNVPEPATVATEKAPPETAVIAAAELRLQDEQEGRRRLQARLWSTPLGQMFRRYVFTEATPLDTTTASHRLVNRIFSSVTLTLSRLSALQLMTEDLYEQGVVNDVIHRRISQLQSAIDLKRHSVQAASTSNLFTYVPLFLVIGAAGGSPEIQAQITALAKGVGYRLISWIRPSFYNDARREFQRLSAEKLLSPQLWTGYSVWNGINVFTNSFGAYALVYFRVRSGTEQAASIEERLWIYGIQTLIDIREL